MYLMLIQFMYNDLNLIRIKYHLFVVTNDVFVILLFNDFLITLIAAFPQFYLINVNVISSSLLPFYF